MPEFGFAQTDEEAARRFERYSWVDPFPGIPPALLNSADIADYVAATGMIFPFRPEPHAGLLKPASYEVALGGPYIYWDEDGIKHEDTIDSGYEFTLKGNSIAFVTLEPMFRIPAYMALRFNLRISHIYKGLLLGTGPLVDPGFVGRLSIPLHNLTLTDYTLVGGDGLIWMEFTKLSPLPSEAVTRHAPQRDAQHDKPKRSGRFVEFDSKKKDLSLAEYLRKASPNQPVRSSIPVGVAQAADAAKSAKATAERIRNVAYLSGVVLVIAVAALVVQVFSVVNDTNARIDELRGSTAQTPSSTTTSTAVPTATPTPTPTPTPTQE